MSDVWPTLLIAICVGIVGVSVGKFVAQTHIGIDCDSIGHFRIASKGYSCAPLPVEKK